MKCRLYEPEEFYDMEEDEKVKTNNDNVNEDVSFKYNNNITTKIPPKKILEKENIINENDYQNKLYSPIKLNTSDINTNKKSFYDPLYNYKKRTSLPVEKKDLNLNVWQVFKSAVGKDLSHFGVPVFFNEPLSSLQKFGECFQYAYLLNNASKER